MKNFLHLPPGGAAHAAHQELHRRRGRLRSLYGFKEKFSRSCFIPHASDARRWKADLHRNSRGVFHLLKVSFLRDHPRQPGSSLSVLDVRGPGLYKKERRLLAPSSPSPRVFSSAAPCSVYLWCFHPGLNFCWFRTITFEPCRHARISELQHQASVIFGLVFELPVLLTALACWASSPLTS